MVDIYSRCVNAQQPLSEVLAASFPWCEPHLEQLAGLFGLYGERKRELGVLDLDEPHFSDRGGMMRKLETACAKAGIVFPSTRGALVRLVLESLTASYRATLAELDDLEQPPEQVLAGNRRLIAEGRVAQ